MPKNNNNNTTYLQYYMTLKYREERIRFHTHTLTHTHARVRAHRRRRHPSPLGSRFRLPPPLSLHTLASGMTGGGDGVTQGIKKKPSGRRRPPDGRYGKGGGTGGGGCPETGPTRAAVRYAHAHTHTATHARARSGRRGRTYAAGPELAHAHVPSAERQLFRVHTTGAGTEPASSIPRAAPSVWAPRA